MGKVSVFCQQGQSIQELSPPALNVGAIPETQSTILREGENKSEYEQACYEEVER